jgi:aryl-alcohol dehydrogenase-like predicted oxidoreductase
MQYREVGETGVRVSVVGIGAWQMGGPDTEDGVGHGWGDVDDDRSVRIIHHGEDLGINLIDTADIYGNGRSEEVIGRALEGRRDRWIVATKGGLVKDPKKRGQYFDGSAKHIREACEGSLTRLRTDVIDFYQLHGMPAEDEAEGTMEELAKLRGEGKIRYYGISTGNADHIRTLEKHGPVEILQIGFNLLHLGEKQALDYCAEKKIGTFIRTPLAWGAAFGRYAREKAPAFEFGDNRHGRSAEQLAEDHQPGLSFSFLWEDSGRTPAQAALRYVLDTPGVTSVIPGIKKMEHLEDDAGAGDAPALTDEEMKRVEEVQAQPTK